MGPSPRSEEEEEARCRNRREEGTVATEARVGAGCGLDSGGSSKEGGRGPCCTAGLVRDMDVGGEGEHTVPQGQL